MSISEMTHMSHFFAVVAALSAVAALTMFFVYDISQCWQIVRGKRTDAPSAKKRNIKRVQKTRKENTEKLDSKACESTLLPDLDATTPLGTMDMLQDITMMDVSK